VTPSGLKSVAIVSEDLSSPLDEGFKKATASLAGAIAAAGIRTAVFTRDAGGLPRAAALLSEPLPANKLLRGRTFAQRLRASHPEAILYVPQAAATPMSLLRARLLGRQAGTPVAVLSLQARPYPQWAAGLFRALRPALVITVSERSRRAAEGVGLRARTVRLGVDSAVFRPAGPGEKEALRQRYGIPQGKVMLHVGHVSARRNLELLRLAAAGGGHPARSRQAPGETVRRLVIVASTSTSGDPAVRRAFAEAPVTFVDRYVERIEEIYRAADCYLFPTFCPTGAIELPLSVLEALSSNLPVVTTAFGGIPDVLSEGHGLYIATSERQFLEKLEGALALGDTGTRDLVAGLTWEKAASGVIEAIESVTASTQRKEAP
jgi:glycosyltransferase involved in cell wall biosynthesis